MNFYLAPLEGITGYQYRNAVHRFFGDGVDKYFTPFFAPHTKRTMNTREMKDCLPANNQGINLVPQILTNTAEDFLRFERDMHAIGYEEVNINIGCPSGTVTSHGRGSGMLRDTDALDRLLYGIFEKKTGPVSVKTRIGYSNPEEFYEILDIYNRYDMSELIIHPRVREEFYKGRCHRDIFIFALNNSNNDLCWSGDINTVADYEKLISKLGDNQEKLKSVMLGRGMVSDPSLIRRLAGGSGASRQELYDFTLCVCEELKIIMPNEKPVLDKMKELWVFMIKQFPGQEKLHKKLLKTKSLEELMIIQKEIIFKGDFLGE